MGSLFRYIADNVTQGAEFGECPCCHDQASLLSIQVAIDDDEWTYSSDCAEEICLECIRRLPLRKFAPRRGERIVQEMINSHYPKGTLTGEQRISKLVSICDEYRRTPRFPLFLQNEDWPWCCGDFCEYQGVPKSYDESIRIGQEMECWEGDFKQLYGDVTLEPESLREVCIFRCLTCGKQVFTWQMT
jgi:uncharacterized protein CbrC (UPF0167 family)